MQRGWLLCQPFIFLHLCKSSQYRIVAFFRLLHQYTVYSLRCLPPRLLSEPTLFDLIRQDGQPFSGAACFPHFVTPVTITGRRIFSAFRLPCIAGCKTGGHIFSHVFSGNAILKNSLHNTSLIFHPLPG